MEKVEEIFTKKIRGKTYLFVKVKPESVEPLLLAPIVGGRLRQIQRSHWNSFVLRNLIFLKRIGVIIFR